MNIYTVTLYSPNDPARLYPDGRDRMTLLTRSPTAAVRAALRMANAGKYLQRIEVSK